MPLFIAGLCMMPFLVPWLDRRAKADLAAIRAARAEEPSDPGTGEHEDGDREDGEREG